MGTDKFWAKWYKADELERLRLVKTLPLNGLGISKHGDMSLINSYLVDLAEYLERKLKGNKEVDK